MLMRQVVEPDGSERIVNTRPDFFACDRKVFGAEGYVRIALVADVESCVKAAETMVALYRRSKKGGESYNPPPSSILPFFFSN